MSNLIDKPCLRGHIAKRKKSNNACWECIYEKRRAERLANPELVRAKDREARNRNIEKRREQKRESIARGGSETKAAAKIRSTLWDQANSQKRASAAKVRRGKKRLDAQYDAFLASLEGAQS